MHGINDLSGAKKREHYNLVYQGKYQCYVVVDSIYMQSLFQC